MEAKRHMEANRHIKQLSYSPPSVRQHISVCQTNRGNMQSIEYVTLRLSAF